MSQSGSQWFEIPIQSPPQSFQATLGGTLYNLTLLYRNVPGGAGFWTLDIADAQSNPILQGIPLVTGADLLAQYDYLDFGGQLIVSTDNEPDAIPTFANLGTTSHLYWVPNP